MLGSLPSERSESVQCSTDCSRFLYLMNGTDPMQTSLTRLWRRTGYLPEWRNAA